MRRAVVVVALVLCVGCAQVAPYQRGYLARPDMAMESSPGMTRAMERTFVAKEAASGGASVGGGGCGCN